MRERVVARRYAAALFEIGLDQGVLDPLQESLCAFSQAMRTVQLFATFLTNSEIPRRRREALISAVCELLGCSDLAKDFFFVMLAKERFDLVPYVADIFQDLVTRAKNLIRAEVIVADESLVVEVSKRITELLEQKLSQPTQCESHVDPALIGGVMLKLGDTILDASVRGRLDKLKQTLLQ